MNDVKLWKIVDEIVKNSCPKCSHQDCDWRLNPRKLITSRHTDVGKISEIEIKRRFLYCIVEKEV